ncbi:CYTH domain-containing protein [Enterococcus rivorum]|uniref:Adenylate cyclase n=1 Tax=Enterococcus rivorum TaxID=762845 RepID=A0A1E5KZL8_9ENTE|nr:CYTH domain-containing protein [Enterococcus rivorum]MBP2099268.1 uncharacterized protein YjbK [Enterococcus rivorum]OEH83352.1 adenylate cyclase [Enterococcus rivorum]
MSENLEIEFKSLLTEKEFSHLLNHFEITEEDCFTQTNYYFDSKDLLLKQNQMGLRIRILPFSAELTLKIPANEGLLEISESLPPNIAIDLIELNQLPDHGIVYDKLISLGFSVSDLTTIGSLKTKRAEKKIPEGLLALDESWFGNQHDFEIELEVSNAIEGKKAFISLLKKLTIKEKVAPNKIQRMMIASSNKF